MKRFLRRAAVQRLLASVVVAYAKFLAATMSWTIENREAVDEAVAARSGAVALFWHGRIGLAVACAKLLGAKDRRVMVSLSRDGDFIAMAAQQLGVPVIRGSSGKGTQVTGKGGGTAFRRAVEFLRSGGALLLTPDGPRGPREVLSIGAVRLAAAAGVPVFLAGLAAKPSFGLQSWDRARLPLPFARGRLIVDGPLIADGAEGTNFERLRAEWQERMTRIQRRAEDQAGSPAAPRKGGPPGLRCYVLATRAVAPLAPAILAFRTLVGKEDRLRRAERLGRPSRARPAGPMVWLHGASIGESLSLLPLVTALAPAAPDQAILVTSGTRTSAALLAGRLPADVIHQYAPIDTPAATSGFLDHWRPRLAIFAESELWPNLLLGAKSRNVIVALVSARMSRASFNRWRRAPKTARALLASFDLILARDQGQAERLSLLGAHVDAVADLKFAGEALPADEDELRDMRAEIGKRPVVLAASTHPGEEAIILSAWTAARRKRPNKALLIIVPRHPQRGAEIRRQAQAAGLGVGLRSQRSPLATLDVYVADSIGELGLFYRLSALAFLGGSLTQGGGGHNPLEAARLGCPFFTGPYFENWPVYRELQALRATRCVRDTELGAVFLEGLADPSSTWAMAERARTFVRERECEARLGVARVLELLGR